jgi:hypothetical protein
MPASSNFPRRQLFMRSEQARESALSLIRNLPLDEAKPVTVTVEAFRPARKPDQNALMWAGPLKDIADQAWLEGRQFGAETWHEFFKRNLLPEDDAPDLELLVKAGYRKWDIDPAGQRVLIGSTTQLTVRGMALYITELEAFGANLGVQYGARPA